MNRVVSGRKDILCLVQIRLGVKLDAQGTFLILTVVRDADVLDADGIDGKERDNLSQHAGMVFDVHKQQMQQIVGTAGGSVEAVAVILR